MYFLPELEVVCIGPHTSECTFSSESLPEALACAGLPFPAHSLHKSSEARLSSGQHLTHHKSQGFLKPYHSHVLIFGAKDLRMAGLPPEPHPAAVGSPSSLYRFPRLCSLPITTSSFVITAHVMSSNNILFPLSVMSRT